MPMQPGQPPVGVMPFTAPINPVIMQQPIPAGMMYPGASIPMQMPMQMPMQIPMAGAPMAGGPGFAQGGLQFVSGNPGAPMTYPGGYGVAGGPAFAPEPASGLGATASEIQAHHAALAADPENEINQPQDIKPADPNPARMYWCREVDGNWTQRNLATIEILEDCRWYITDDGCFYTVRLPN
jgi:hypothetical protein